jgi:hypothetical protein
VSASSAAGGVDLFARLAEYTASRLTYASDALNGMLGVLQVFAERERNPVYHLCGVPVLHETGDVVRVPGWFGRRRGGGGHGDLDDGGGGDGDDAASLARAGFVNGLCWALRRPAPRREGFPRWSWAGWHGVVDSQYGHSPGIVLEYGFDVDVSIMLEKGACSVEVQLTSGSCDFFALPACDGLSDKHDRASYMTKSVIYVSD